jgi:hypothetical protein
MHDVNGPSREQRSGRQQSGGQEHPGGVLRGLRALPGLNGLRQWLARQLRHWSLRLQPAGPDQPLPVSVEPLPFAASPAAALPLAFGPALREPLSVQAAVEQRDLTLLRREAADGLAALAAAHALVTSARFSELQQLRQAALAGEAPLEPLSTLVADYQGWHSDQVRLFDALGLVLRMRVPLGTAFDQLDPAVHAQARSHLETLSLEYQRAQLNAQFQAGR